MRFLVTIDGSNVGAGLPPEQIAKIREQRVVPGVEKLAQWERKGKIHGGGFTGARGSAFVIEADSIEEVDRLVTGLPHWGLVKVDVKPLISMSSMLERIKR